MADPIVIYLTGDPLLDAPFFFAVPEDWNNLDNKIEMIGGGGRGAGKGGGGGAGGHYVRRINVSLVPGEVVSYQLKSTGNGTYSVNGDFDTWFKSPTFMLAKAGLSATDSSGAVSPDASESIGDLVHKGGDGGDGGGDLVAPYGYRGGGGGGSAGSATGDGYKGGDADPDDYGGGGGAGTQEDGADASELVGGDGGDGDGVNGRGGKGGDGRGSHQGEDGEDGESGSDPYGPTPFASGAAGGGAGGDPDLAFNWGGDGGYFGGGSGGSSWFDNFGSFGSRGIIKITYTPVVTPPSRGAIVVPALRRAENVKPFHLLEIDAAVVGAADPTLAYVYGIGSAPIDALSLESVATVSRRTFVYSDKGYRTPLGDPGGPKVSLARLLTPPEINRVLNLSPGAAAAGFSWGSGQLARNNDDYNVSPDAFLGINYYSTDGAPVRMYLGLKTRDEARGLYVDPLTDDLLPIFTGVAQQWLIGRQAITVAVRDMLYLLDQPLQRTAYSGVGGLGGDAAITGMPLPMTRGGTATYPVCNVRPVLVDAANRIYQYNNAPGTVQALYEGAYAGIPFQADTDDLYSGSTDSGKYRTDDARGLFQLGSDPVGEITCDVTGEFSRGGAIVNPCKIARFLITEDVGLSPSLIDLGGFTLAEAQYDYTAGVYFDPQGNISAIDAVTFLVGSIGARVGTSRLGLIRPFVIRQYSYPADDAYGIGHINGLSEIPLPDDVSPVISRIRVRWRKNWTVQTSGSLEAATLEQKQFAATGGSVTSWASGVNLTKYPSAKDPAIIETALLKENEAQSVADALGALWGIPRRAFQIDLPVWGLDRDLADNISFAEDIGIRPYPFYCFVYGIKYVPGQPNMSLLVIS